MSKPLKIKNTTHRSPWQIHDSNESIEGKNKRTVELKVLLEKTLVPITRIEPVQLSENELVGRRRRKGRDWSGNKSRIRGL